MMTDSWCPGCGLYTTHGLCLACQELRRKQGKRPGQSVRQMRGVCRHGFLLGACRDYRVLILAGRA